MTSESDAAATDRGGPSPLAIASKPAFGAGKAIAILVLLSLAQIAVGIVVAVVSLIWAAARGEGLRDPDEVKLLMSQLTLPLLLLSPLVATVVIALFTRMWAWEAMKDSSPAGIGWRPAPLRDVCLSAVVGAVIVVTYSAVARFLLPPQPGTPLGPLTALAAAGGVGRAAWAIVAVFLAPPLEEFLFRGLLLKGVSASWGPGAAYILVTAVFVVFHLFETYHYLPALIGITLLAIATLIARIKTASIVPPISLHSAYNLVLVLWVYTHTA